MLIYIKYSIPSSTLKLKLGEYVCIRVYVCIYGWVIGWSYASKQIKAHLCILIKPENCK